MSNLLVVLSGPSGVGKGTVAKKLVEANKDFALSVSCTTRKPRRGEKDGREYFFIDKDEFLSKIKEDGFLEYSEHFENYYGTPKDFVFSKLNEKDVILEIDVNGGISVKKNFEKALLIMLAPPSVEEVRKRLVKRNTETEDKINLRMQRMQFELDMAKDYDYTVVNDDLNRTVKEIQEIIKKEKIGTNLK